MVTGAFTPPPPVRDVQPTAREDLPRADVRDKGDAFFRVFAITLLGVVGFLGLLIAACRLPSLATPLRVLALVWFAAFGVWHARASGRIS